MTGGTLAVVAILVAAAILVVVWGVRSRRGPRDARPPYILALSALADGDPASALEEFKNAVRIDSTNVDAYLRLGDLFRDRGEPERGHQIHRELATRHKLSTGLRSKIHLSLCRDLVELGRLEKAEEEAREAVRLAEDPGEALEVQLSVLEKLGDIEGAFRVRREALKRRGNLKSGAGELAEFRARQGLSLLEKGELKQAEKVLRDALKLDEKNVLARRTRGALHEKKGDYPATIEDWSAILRDTPEDTASLLAELERVHFLNGTYSEMETIYSRLLERTSGHEEASFGLARFLRRKGRIDEALDICRRALDTRPESESLRVLRLALLLDAERTAEAETVLNQWIGALLGHEPTIPDDAPADASGPPPLETAP